MVKLNLGSGIVLKKGFVNVDKAYTHEQLTSGVGIFKDAVLPKSAAYVQADILHLPFANDYADYVELFNTIEHVPMRQQITALTEIYRVMKKGAKLLIVTNAFNLLVIDWLNSQIDKPFDYATYLFMAEPIYGNQLAEGEFHVCPMTPAFLNFCLSKAGFTSGNIGMFDKYAPTPVIGTLPEGKAGELRNALLTAEVTK